MSILLSPPDVPSVPQLFWSLALASCHVFNDYAAICWGFTWSVPW